MARLTRNERMTAPDHFQDVRLLEFEHVFHATTVHAAAAPPDGRDYGSREHAAMTYEPGDVFCIKPENAEASVQRFLDRMGWTDVKDEIVELQNLSESECETSPAQAENPDR